jgi:peptidyl-prolyl cis-trans isomerase SurA
MFLRVSVILTFGLALILNSCASEPSQIILAKFGDQNITVKDFENAYVNNVGSYEIAKNDSLSKLKSFLDLYVNFQMKLKDANVKGYENDPELQKELTDYKKQIGVSYILNKQLVEPGIKQLYERRKWERRVSIILIKSKNNSKLSAEKLANSLIDSLKNGASFEKLAIKYSDDPNAARDSGDIYYVTAGQFMSNEFENAVYSTEQGNIYPKPVFVDLGYCIIKVTAIRPRIPEVKFSHMMAAYAPHSGDKPDTLKARIKMDSILAELKNGVDFDKVAEKYSDDPHEPTSTKKKIDYGYVDNSKLGKLFTEPLFTLKNIGDITPVIQNKFGFHILKLTDKRTNPSFDQQKDRIKEIYKEKIYPTDYDTLVAGLKNKYQYKVDKATVSYLLANIDTGNVGDINPKYDNVKDSVLFSFTGSSVNVREFLEKFSNDQDFVNHKITPDLFKEALTKISNNAALEQEALILDKSDSEFAALMNNYKNGIFVFKVREDEILNKVKIDSVKLLNFYSSTKENYSWPDRVNFSEIFAHSDSAIQSYYDLLAKGENFDSVAAKYTERTDLKSKNGVWGLVDVSSSELAGEAFKLEKPGDYSKPILNQSGYSILQLISKDPAHLKTFEEAKEEVSGAYQEVESKRLEKDYIENLTKLYNPVIYYSNLDKVFKSN